MLMQMSVSLVDRTRVLGMRQKGELRLERQRQIVGKSGGPHRELETGS